MTDTNFSKMRRNWIAGSGAAYALAAAGGLSRSASAADDHKGHGKGVAAIMVDAGREGVCATCRYWGGTRRVTEDKKSVYAESLGWCNNSESPHFLSMRQPEAGPMKMWRKWDALS